ncbi:MAG: pilus assembly PilX N-terminal domain-containing protein [Syntrophobacterales bacterium]|nr:pilus assembly PilX N-terminal domain-containing protein [Syntrophobacterales bacterium]
MQSIFKHGRRKNECSEKGFVLVLAVLGIALILAIGVLALTMSGRDVRISSRVVGEQKAFSACESGVHYLTTILDPTNLFAVNNHQVDPSNDPASRFSIAMPSLPASGPAMLPLAGYSIGGGQTWGQTRYDVTVTGENTNYNSRTQVDMSFGYGPIEMTTISR